MRLNNQGKNKFAAANKNYTFVDKNGNSTITGQIEYVVDPAQLVITITGTASKVFNDEDAVITQKQINEGDIKIVWNNSDDEPTDLGKFSLTPEDLEVIDSEGNPVKHANAGYNDDGTIIKGEPYRVRLTSAAIEKIEQLSGASNYAVSQSDNSGKYFIYEHKAELTLTGNQTTVYGTALPFDESKYTLHFSNWLSNDPKPHLTWENGKLYNNGKDTGVTYTAGDLYVDGYPDGSVPTNVGSYVVKISKNLTDALRKLFPDYDFAGNIGTSGIAKDADGGIIEPVHTPADYVITPAVTTITISGAQHVKYGESTAIVDGQYTASVTAPVSGKETNVVTDVALSSADLTTVPSDASVGGYTIKLTATGLKKIQDAITGHGDVRQNYNWTQADNASANFFVDQMPVTIAVTGDQSVVYGSSEWLKAIKANPSGYTLTVTTENGTKLSYTAKDGDLVFNQTPGNVGEYQVELSAQGLNNIEKELGTNYAYPQIAADVTAKGTLTVNQGAVTITLNGSDGKTYDAKQTLPSGLDLKKYGLTYSVTVYSADGTAQTLDLTADDLQIVGNATNVGTYQVELSSAGQEKLKQLTGNNGANYKWTFDTKADYKITAATATAELSGSNEKTFDGSAVTTAEVNSNGKILVHFTFPGSTTQSTYVLQNGDYTWNTEDGKAPANVGNYTISLNKDSILSYLQAAINNQAGSGNIVITADNLSGQASFKITPKAITNVTVSGNTQSKIYNGQAAELDVSGLTISANDTVANTPLVNPGIKASDFTWYDANGAKLDSIPTDVGTYQARLNASVLAELQKVNPNYQFDSVDGVIDYEITPATANASINGSVSRDYNARTTSVSDVMNNIQWTSTGLISGQDLNLTGLTANSYVWYSKNTNGDYVAMTGDPVNAGTYYLRLTDAAIAQVKTDNPNYHFTSVNGEFTYTINTVAGTATLSGSSSKTYDGQAVTVAEVDSTNGNIIVSFTFPGSNDQSTYTLQAGDYTWENKDGQSIEAPTNVGTYIIKLSESGRLNFQNAINQYAGQGNVTLNAQGLLGSATYTIKQKNLNVILGNNNAGADGKTYNGQPAAINTQAVKFGVFTTTGLVNGEKLNIANLTNSDYEWVDANGQVIETPTNVGTYYIALTAAGLQKLQADNPNYAISESGQFTYVINPAEGNVTISGSQESPATVIDGNNFRVNVPVGVTVPSGMVYEFEAGIPSESGIYAINLTPESVSALEKANPNYKLNISSDAKFTLDAVLSIEFEDTQDGNKQVGETITKIGVAGSTISDLKLVVPENYELATDQELPTSYTFGKELSQSLYIKLIHKTNEINPTNPSTNPDPNNKNWFKENGLVKDITRTINYEGLSKTQLAQIPESQKLQTVEFTRTAKYDLVTEQIVAGSEGTWTPVDGKDTFTGFVPFRFAGYTATPATIEEVKVTSNDHNIQTTVTYAANAQTGKISYIDRNGNEVSQTALTGKTGQEVEVDPQAPSGWKIVSGQNIPKSVRATATGIPTVIVKVEHSTIIVTPETPEKDIPTGPVPGDPNKNYEKMESLTVSPTRTIVVTDPSGETTKVVQVVNFTRTATFDEVTGEITYSNWQFENSNSNNHAAQWDGYTPQLITHYVASMSKVPVEEVTANTVNTRVEITYSPASESQVIRYVDKNGKEISKQIVPGKYGVDTPFTPKLPNNWQETSPIPSTVKIGENGGTTTVIIEAKSENVEQTRTVTETIHYQTANGKQVFADKEMEVSFTRTGVKNLVTGEIIWNDWNKEDESFNAIPSPVLSGYTASPDKIAAQTVTPNSEDLVFTVIYTKDQQTHPTIPNNKPNKPQEENVPKHEHKTQDELIHEYGYKKDKDGRLIDHTDHVYPAGSKVKENGAIYSEKGELLSVGSRRNNELPQTGLHDNSLIAAIGSLLAGMSIFGLLGGRKKKDDDK